MSRSVTQQQVGKRARVRIIMYSILAFIFTGAYFTPSSTKMTWGANIMMLFFVGLIWWKLIKWLRVRRVTGLFPQYVHAIDQTPSMQLDQLARRLDQPQNRVARNMTLMARVGLLPQVAFSKDGTYALMGSAHESLSQWRQTMAQREEGARQQQEAALRREEAARLRQQRIKPIQRGVKCDSCGAKSLVTKGTTPPCPYCGNPLNLPTE